MPTLKKKSDFYESVEGIEAKEILQSMVTNEIYNTDSSYSTNSDLYPDNKIPFVDKHLSYLRSHPSVDQQHYLSNLRLMTKIRS
jgi:hypothetical protein